MSDYIDYIARTIPDFLFAIVLFWLCQQNADKQREAYQTQINTMFSMIESMMSHLSRTMDIIESKSPARTD